MVVAGGGGFVMDVFVRCPTELCICLSRAYFSIRHCVDIREAVFGLLARDACGSRDSMRVKAERQAVEI